MQPGGVAVSKGVWYKGSQPPVSGSYWVMHLRTPGAVTLSYFRLDRHGVGTWTPHPDTIIAWAKAQVPTPPDSVNALPTWKDTP
jgi:hypothetical protein